jgi:hypothetical protein
MCGYQNIVAYKNASLCHNSCICLGSLGKETAMRVILAQGAKVSTSKLLWANVSGILAVNNAEIATDVNRT